MRLDRKLAVYSAGRCVVFNNTGYGHTRHPDSRIEFYPTHNTQNIYPTVTFQKLTVTHILNPTSKCVLSKNSDGSLQLDWVIE